ncbi:bifunctional MaoC family dehydratase N-terminal/OB-fold nucleic acid binding domain-containing protein [Rhodococcus sp. JS3073]|uniref:bifunctional MaoC family dehydratase N-terminal/OB-fold nucleic acid binding domain-containing protein n=1 Tax=Rhodococcus sp. JS3073 TaxID=3002901 RepID=UPI0022855961|nr:bifunctional MaoC family dehydratase N-terminal/OB-fold nucleic acid binding domain-containing protein [Rhodococcus sp. JS3073]WAM16458.1 bifunctional MaoC family dehydratase N-terminal/OB-fold nucleic acid binding domain-containing protein [Rhodococcus sp. JS3073]
MSELLTRLRAFEGRTIVPATWGPDPVNTPMIRHWVEAMGDTSPVYLDDDAAHATGRGGAVAPAQMLQVWTMRTYADKMTGADPSPVWTELIATFDEAGFTSVVATDSDQEFFAELRPGDRVSTTEVVESVSAEKQTGLGAGHFVTTLKTYRNGDGEIVGTQRWRTLRFRPAERPAPRALRPRPAIDHDNAFWFAAAREHRLVIQRCASCGVLRHPTGPMCGECRSTEWDTVDASGRGTVYTFVVNHHPKIDAFDYPLIVAVIELEEGTRLIANMTGVEPEHVHIGMPVELVWIDADPELTLPAFRPTPLEDH